MRVRNIYKCLFLYGSYAFRSYWRDAFLFEYLVNPRCELASAVVSSKATDCIEKCSSACHPGFDITNWRNCLLTLGVECRIKPKVYFSASISDVLSVCYTSEKELVVPEMFHCDDCIFEPKFVSFRISIPDELVDKCRAAEYNISGIDSLYACKRASTVRREWIAEDAKLLIPYESGINMLLVTFQLPIKGVGFIIRSSLPECLFPKENFMNLRLYGVLLTESFFSGMRDLNSTHIVWNERDEFYLGKRLSV